jgi:hypothetical protein
VAESSDAPRNLTGRFARWLLKDRVVESEGRAAKEGPEQHS